MSNWEVWLVIALLTIATLIDRSAFWLLGHYVQLPTRVQEALRYAPACALAAIIVPDLLIEQDQLLLSPTNPKLIAALCATAYFVWRRSMLTSIVLGMAVFTAMNYFHI